MNPSRETCKSLTLYLGECWHEASPGCYCMDQSVVADHTPKDHLLLNRPFTTPADFFAVYGKMVERGEWEKFDAFLWQHWYKALPERSFGWQFNAWLFCLNAPSQIGERMEMVSTWLKEKER